MAWPTRPIAQRQNVPLLIRAVQRRKPALAKWLIDEARVDLNAKEPERGRTALMHALMGNDKKMVRVLMGDAEFGTKNGNEEVEVQQSQVTEERERMMMENDGDNEEENGVDEENEMEEEDHGEKDQAEEEGGCFIGSRTTNRLFDNEKLN